MTSQEKAKLLSEHCVDTICDLRDCDDAEMVAKICCLVELLEIARAAKELVGGPHRHIKGCNCEHCTLLKALAVLRRKLPKGI